MDYNLVNLDANHYELVMQDKVNLTMSVDCKEKSKEAALKSLKIKIREVQEIFKNHKLVAQLSYQTVNEENESVGSKWRKTGYWNGFGHLQIIAYDFELINKIVEELIETNKAQLHQAVTSISEKTKQAKEEEITTQAINVFQTKAKNITKAFGSKSHTLVNVTVHSATDEQGNQRGVLMASAGSMESAMVQSSEYSSSYISPRESKIYVNIKGSVQLQ